MVNPANQRDRSAVQGPSTYNKSGSYFSINRECKTTTTMGRITPVLIMETMPGDKISIRTEMFSRFAPLFLPLMHRATYNIQYFYVPLRIMWREPRGWETFITQRLEVEWPHFSLVTAVNNPVSSIGSYLGIPDWTGSVTAVGFSVSCFPICAFFHIWNEYYRNPQLQAEFPYLYLTEGENDVYENIYLALPPHDLWNRDYFTTALPQPLAGDDILMPLVNDGYTLSNGQPVGGPFRLRDLNNVAISGGTVTVDPSDWPVPTSGGLSMAASNIPSYLDIQETAPSIRQLRVAARLYEFMEHLNRSSYRYRDFIKAEFNIDPDAGVVDRPVWFGGQRGEIVISEVMSQAEVTDLGFYAGQALAAGTGKKHTIFCQEHGIIIANLVIKPISGYGFGLSRMWRRTQPLDYPFVEFSGIGDQPIYGHELVYQIEAANAAFNTQEWGYVQRFADWKQSVDLVTGGMRTIWKNFHLARLWDQGEEPALNDTFVVCNPRITDVFQVAEGEDECYVYCYHKVDVWRRLPQIGIGRL